MFLKYRTPGEWEKEWHQERYSRCRDSITRHLRWACEKDIYKLKRSEARDIFALKRSENIQPNEETEDEEEKFTINNVNAFKDTESQPEILETEEYDKYPWLNQKLAMGLIRTRRGLSKRSGVITQECCSPKGCTWEEYAEYCTQNNRKVPHKRYQYVYDY